MSSLRQAFRGQAQSSQEERVKLLVPIVGNESDARLLTYVSKIANKKNTEVTLIYVVEVDQELPLDADLPVEVTQGERVLQHAQETINAGLDSRSSIVNTDLLQARLAGPAIVDESVLKDSDLITMSADVFKRLGKRTCGDTIDYVLRNAPCEVLILRGPMTNKLVQELEIEVE